MDAILFDWDGTLADSLRLFLGANAAVMAELGVPFDETTYRRIYTPDWRVVYRRLGVPEHRLDEANERWRRHFDARRDETRPIEGAREALERLAATGHRLGVVTAGDRAVVGPQIERFGMAELLTVRVYGDDLAEMKPHPAPLRRALAALGLAGRPDAVAYVGDAPDDMRMARTAGSHAVGITSLLGEEPALRAAGALETAPSVAVWAHRLLAARPA